MARLMLNAVVPWFIHGIWSKLQEIMLQHRIYDKPNLRMMVEAILYRMRVGCPWRDLPVEFGFWNSIYQQFNRWSAKNKLMKIFKYLVQYPDLEWEFIDGSIIRAHQHSSGAVGAENQAIGKSAGGNTTKIHMAVDAFGLPIEFLLTGGKYMMLKKPPISLKNFLKQISSLQTEVMIARKFANKSDKNHLSQLFHGRGILKLVMLILIGVYTNIAIWLKTYSRD